MIYRSRTERRRIAEQAAETRRKRAAGELPPVDAGKSTCQICGRPIMAKTGRIAHHGYQRPGMGWQTSSCEGARELPFEVSRDALGHHIDALAVRRATMVEMIGKVDREEVAVRVSYTVHQRDRFNQWEKVPVYVNVTRENFDAMRAEHVNGFRTAMLHSFEDVKKTRLRYLRAEVHQLDEYQARQSARFTDWKPAVPAE